jgi:hypothetical protein
MTNRIAIILGAIFVALIAVDNVMYGSEYLVFLLQKMSKLIEYMAFWR